MATKKRESAGGESGGGAGGPPKKAKNFSIDSLINDMDNTMDELNSGKQTKYDGSRTSQVIESVLQTITQIAAKVPLNTLEVEIRVGLLSSSTGFRPGVHQDDFDFLMELLNKARTPTMTEEVDYIYADERGRVTWDAEETRVLRAINKQNYQTFDIGTNLAYDLRVSLASEQDLHYTSQSVEPGYKTRRHKVRASYRDQFWKAELTTVTVHQGNGLEIRYEVEFELHPSSIPNHANKAHLLEVLTRFVSEPRNLISALEAPNERNFPEVILEKVTNSDELGHLRDACMSCFPPEEENVGQAFPGSMPVNFSRRHFAMVQNADYYVSEKTDGLRYMLLVTPEAPYFIDRKFDFYMIQGFELLIELYGASGITLLDGEMVRNLTTKRPVFMLFDALQLNGAESAAAQPLTQRFTLINDAVGAFRAALASKRLDERSLPFSIIGKRFYPKTQINVLFQEIRTTHEGHEYRDKEAKRHHFTDGLIFTPNTRYLTYTSHHILKWKYIEKLTIDFKYKTKNQKRYLACAAANDIEVECRELLFSDSDTKRLFKDVARARDQLNIIIECNFDTITGIWKYHGLRQDKHKANFIYTVFDTMENIAENISTEEIRYRIAVQQKYDDWDVKMKMARDGLLGKLLPGHQNSAHGSSHPARPPPSSSHPQHVPPPKPSSSSLPPSSSSLPHPPAPTPKRVPIPASSLSSSASSLPSSSQNKPLSVTQPISTYEFGDDEDEYDEEEEPPSHDNHAHPPSHPPPRTSSHPPSSHPPPSHIPKSNGNNSNNNNNNNTNHGYQPPPISKSNPPSSSTSYDDDEITSGEDWQRPEEEYEYDDRPDGGEDHDE